MRVAAEIREQAVGDEFNVMPHEVVVHADKVDRDRVAHKLMLDSHCLGYDLEHALATRPVVEHAAQSSAWRQSDIVLRRSVAVELAAWVSEAGRQRDIFGREVRVLCDRGSACCQEQTVVGAEIERE